MTAMKRTILFQGDSITDCFREEESTGFLGKGYVRMVADVLAQRGEDVTILNRGVGGHRTKDLLARWTEDCIDLQPDIFSLMIGINDCWGKYAYGDEVPIDVFEANLDKLLIRVGLETRADIILMEPFVLPIPEDRIEWRVTLDPMIHATRRQAKKHGAKLIPLDGIFAAAAMEVGYEALVFDGVHPIEKGHELIRDAWLAVYDTMK
jgi:lysophospholipase L1-like esterase